jgi:hypothetical protein
MSLHVVTPTSDLTRLPELEAVDRVVGEVERACAAADGWTHDMQLTSTLAGWLVDAGWERRRAVLLIGAVARRWKVRRDYIAAVARCASSRSLDECQAKARRRWLPTLTGAHEEVRQLIHPEVTP